MTGDIDVSASRNPCYHCNPNSRPRLTRMTTLLQPQIRRDARHSSGPALMPSYAPRGVAFQLGVPGFFALLGIAAMSVDMPLARMVDAEYIPDSLKKAFDLAEVFAHGYGALAILIAVWVLAPERR